MTVALNVKLRLGLLAKINPQHAYLFAETGELFYQKNVMQDKNLDVFGIVLVHFLRLFVKEEIQNHHLFVQKDLIQKLKHLLTKLKHLPKHQPRLPAQLTH